MPERSAVSPGASADGAAGASCSGKCIGRAPSGFGHAFQIRAARAQGCYDRALRDDHDLRGHMALRVRVATDGTVCALGMGQSDMPEEMNECVLGFFREVDGPAPIGGCVDVTVPITFVPPPADGGAR